MNPVFLPVRELAEAVRARRISPVELAETFLDRLERLGPRYNAVVTLTRERALVQARRAEGEIAAGRWRGPLHGIPYGAKDLLATAGIEEASLSEVIPLVRQAVAGVPLPPGYRVELSGAYKAQQASFREFAGGCPSTDAIGKARVPPT